MTFSAAPSSARCGARSTLAAQPRRTARPQPAGRLRAARRRTATRSPRASTAEPARRTPRPPRWPRPATAARGATAVVTLEPCNHTGRTGPCAEALVDGRRTPRGRSPSPTPTRSPPGARRRCATPASRSRAACSRDEARALNRAWTFAVEHGRPFVTWKFATTLDGRSAAADGTSRWVSSRAARLDTHRLRAAVRRDAGRHRHGRGRRPRADRPRRGRRAAAAPAAARGDGAARPRPAAGGSSTTAPRRSTCAPATRARRWPSCTPATASTSSSRAARRWPRRSSRPAWSTRSSPTSRRCCSAPGASAVGRPRHHHHRRRAATSRVTDVTVLDGHDGERRQRPHHHDARTEGDLMFTGIVEELGTVEAVEDQGDAIRLTVARPHRARGRRRSATRSRSTAAA